MDQQLKAIRLVTERYRELQGLRTALFGASLILVFGAVLSMAPRGNSWVIPLAVAALLALAIPGDRVLSRYYNSRFGRLVPERGRTSGLMFVLIVVVLSVMNNAFDVGLLTAALPIVAGSSLWIVLRDWPIRAHYLLGTLGASAALGPQFMTPPLERSVADALGMVVLGATYVPIGLLDHWILVRTLHGSPQPEVVSELPRQD